MIEVMALDFDLMHAPLLLFTSTGDMFVTASQYGAQHKPDNAWQ